MKKVLIAEDNQSLQNLLKETLRKGGYSVVVVSNGAEAIHMFDHMDFTVVITDICMPKADGNAISRHIRKSSRPHIPIVVISGNPELWEAHCDAFLLKPFSMRLLVETMKRLESSAKACYVSPFPDFYLKGKTRENS